MEWGAIRFLSIEAWEGHVMDEARRQVLLAELQDAKKERVSLDAFIEVLSMRLGLANETTSDNAASAAVAGQVPAVSDPLELVYANEFIGLSFPKAAETVLNRWSPTPATRPLKTTVLVKALRKGGLDVKDARQVYRALWNAARFHNLKGGAWGLAAWYPASVLNKQKASTSEGDNEPVEIADGALDLPSAQAEGPSTHEGDAS